jgi:hypothetical protein
MLSYIFESFANHYSGSNRIMSRIDIHDDIKYEQYMNNLSSWEAATLIEKKYLDEVFKLRNDILSHIEAKIDISLKNKAENIEIAHENLIDALKRIDSILDPVIVLLEDSGNNGSANYIKNVKSNLTKNILSLTSSLD